MSAIFDYMQLCRLCLVKENVNVPIFGDVRQIFLKIAACMPVKVTEDDNLPKNICDNCFYKVDLLYQFWNTTVNAEKQLIQWLAELGVDVNIKSSNPPQARMIPQSHAHPHSMMPETIILKVERQDPDLISGDNCDQNIQMEMPFQSQANSTVGASTNFKQPVEAPTEEEEKVPQQTPAKRRGRSAKQKTPSTTVTAPAVPETTITTTKRRSSAVAAAAAVAAAVGNASSDESDADDRLGDDDSDDEDMDISIAKEEVDSEDEEYMDNPDALEPTTFVGVPSTSGFDSEQPGPSGLSAGATGKTSASLPTNATNETGQSFYEDNQLNLKDPIEMEPIITIVELPATTGWDLPKKRTSKKKVLENGDDDDDDYNDSDYDPLLIRKTPKANMTKQKIKTTKPTTRKTSPRKAKIDGYKNPIHAKSEKSTTDEKEKSEKKWTCVICNKNLNGKNELVNHYVEHKEDNIKIEDDKLIEKEEYQCDVCLKKFTDEKLFEKHTETHIKKHENEYNYKCEICGKQFVYTRSLKDHKKKIHPETNNTEPVIHECQYCKKRFPQEKNLLLHVRGHTGDNTALCDICGKRLSSNEHLKVHRRIHTGQRPFSCTICGKGFSKKCNLTIHERVHTGEKPYVCNVCGKCFSQRSTLVIHTRNHTGVKPYVCHLCNKGFVAKGVLGIHLKSCNRENIIGNYLVDPMPKRE